MSHARAVRLTRIALMSGLAFLLGMHPVYRLPQGGKISLEMLPIVLLGLWDGTVAGCTLGLLFGWLDFILEPVPPIHWAQFLLDYPVAYGVLGLTGLFRPAWLRSGRHPLLAGGAMLAAGLVSLLAHVLAGVIWFAPGNYGVSALYNATYMVPDIVLTLLLGPFILRTVPPFD